MAVLIEGISVVIKTSAIEDKFPGGDSAFEAAVPNLTLCADSELARVGFMTPDDVGIYIDLLEANGLAHIVDGEASDLVVVDQQRGFTSPCSWAEVGRIPLDAENKEMVTACRLKGSKIDTVMFPEGWKYENSLSHTYGFAPSEHINRSLLYLRRDGNVDVYLNEVTGKEVYVGRLSQRAEDEAR